MAEINLFVYNKKTWLPLRTFAALREINSKMKHLLYLLFFIGCTINLSAQEVLAKPNPPRLVVDAAGFLPGDQQNILEQN